MTSLVALKKSVYLRQMEVKTLNSISGHIRQNGKTIPVRFNTQYNIWTETNMDESKLAKQASASVL